jgi:hypothetical protein
MKKQSGSEIITEFATVDLSTRTLIKSPIVLGDRPFSGTTSDGSHILYDSYMLSTSGENFDKTTKEELCFRDQSCGMFYNQNLNITSILWIK